MPMGTKREQKAQERLYRNGLLFLAWLEIGVRFPTPKIDLWISCAAIALLGASKVIGADSTHHLEIWAFWAGIAGFALLALWHVLAWVLRKVRNNTVTEATKTSATVDNRGGAYIGGNNNGTQQVFHGPVVMNGPTTSRKYSDRDFAPPSLTLD